MIWWHTLMLAAIAPYRITDERILDPTVVTWIQNAKHMTDIDGHVVDAPQDSAHVSLRLRLVAKDADLLAQAFLLLGDGFSTSSCRWRSTMSWSLLSWHTRVRLIT